MLKDLFLLTGQHTRLMKLMMFALAPEDHKLFDIRIVSLRILASDIDPHPLIHELLLLTILRLLGLLSVQFVLRETPSHILSFSEPAVCDGRFFQKFGAALVTLVVHFTRAFLAEIEILQELEVLFLFCCFHSLFNDYFVDLEFMKSTD